jgi:hypothetical protein
MESTVSGDRFEDPTDPTTALSSVYFWTRSGSVPIELRNVRSVPPITTSSPAPAWAEL